MDDAIESLHRLKSVWAHSSRKKKFMAGDIAILRASTATIMKFLKAAPKTPNVVWSPDAIDFRCAASQLHAFLITVSGSFLWSEVAETASAKICSLLPRVVSVDMGTVALIWSFGKKLGCNASADSEGNKTATDSELGASFVGSLPSQGAELMSTNTGSATSGNDIGGISLLSPVSTSTPAATKPLARVLQRGQPSEGKPDEDCDDDDLLAVLVSYEEVSLRLTNICDSVAAVVAEMEFSGDGEVGDGVAGCEMPTVCGEGYGPQNDEERGLDQSQALDYWSKVQADYVASAADLELDDLLGGGVVARDDDSEFEGYSRSVAIEGRNSASSESGDDKPNSDDEAFINDGDDEDRERPKNPAPKKRKRVALVQSSDEDS